MRFKKTKMIRKPSHPGEVLKSLFLDELGYSQNAFAEMLSEATGGSVKSSTMKTKLNEVIRGKRAMSADFAVLIGRVLDTPPKMWMNLQVNLDLWEAEQKVA